jgi:hypothetical protein
MAAARANTQGCRHRKRGGIPHAHFRRANVAAVVVVIWTGACRRVDHGGLTGDEIGAEKTIATYLQYSYSNTINNQIILFK